MNNALLKDNLAARAVDSQTRKVLSRSGLIAGLCISSLVSSYAIPGGVDAAKAKNESVMITQQAKKVSGVVTDSAGEPIPGANVVQKGTTNGTVTDLDGKYTLDVPNNATLVVSFIGYTTQEVKVGSQSVLNVSLAEEAIGLNEVVAIGYGYVKKKDLTGAVSTVSADDMVMGGTVSNAAQALQGKTAGVQVSQSSKAPGGTISVRVRGSNSISSTNEPLYVVDGFPSSEGLNINPNDIESMQILKDASATAIYGARGANGVVLITTKRGKAGENKISYSGYMGAQKIDNPFTFINAKDYMNLQNALYQEIEGQEGNPNGAYTPSQLQSDVDTDWLKETTRVGLVHDHNIQFRGGTEKTKVLTSLGFYQQEGVLKNTDFNRISGRINVDQTINDYIKAGATMYAHREQSNYQMYSGSIVNSNVLLSIMDYDPTVKPYNEDGSYGRVPGGRGDNPLANLLERKNDMTNDKFNGTAFLEVHPFEGFTAKATAGVELLNNFKGTYLPKSTYQGEIEGGVATTYDFRATRQVFEGILNYMKTFNNMHDLNVMLGYSYEKYNSEYRQTEAKGFSTDLFQWNNLSAASTKDIMSNKTENILASFFGRVNYTFKDKYLATVTVRRDGSSRFGVNNHWGTFPSGSLAWRASEEDFIKNLNLFSNLKVRAGYGVTGNERIGDYASYALISTNRITLDGSSNKPGTHLNQSSPENASLKWETTSQYNVGVDMGFFDNRLSVTLDGYWKKTEDLLLKVSLPYYTGFTSGQRNIGAIQNRGFEIDITSHNLTGDFTWDTKFNLAVNRNKVLDLGSSTDIYITSSKPMGTVSEEAYAVVREGESLGSLFGYKYIGVLQEGETYAPQPNSKPGDPKFEDVNKDGKIDSDDRTIIGNANPDVIFGLTNNFAWKGFDLSIFFQGSIGNDLLNMTRMNLEWKRTPDALNRWTPTNTNTDIPRNGFYYSQYGGYINDHFIEDASFLRLKNLTLGYTIPFKKVVSSCRVYFSAENLFTITGYSGWDPEVDTKANEATQSGGSQQTANAGAGLDFNAYPSTRTYTVGLNITF
ncbi:MULTISPECIES: SusC/RagA family TonB-linked outer membrane protein [Parabacteroides]|jgi:TonB-linked SusC/RagA family outer membrane protein|uniref:SusC/RagA family TonB-linked outer membrane protein n=1 Tax=Parabacteroides TaxID=375288 RepID=UPI000EFE7627|nr:MULTISPECIES: TonB-dependent receptor [Parabacteroides]RHU25622.1 TonB-dependent receptor [Parabacteroides sp. TM07-1AC]WFE86040.1 TonB-dependent receptor [Parabacteroides chongii]